MFKTIISIAILCCQNNLFCQVSTLYEDKRITAIDTFYTKYIIKDEYRWLENVRDKEVTDWVKVQNKLSENYLSKASFKTNSLTSIDTYAYTEFKYPIKLGKYYFSYAYYNNYSTPAIYYSTRYEGTPQLLVDPNFESGKDKITIKGFTVSKDSKFLAYQYSRNGSDWAEIKIVSLKNGTKLKDHITGLKFSGIEWRGNGFYYSTVIQDSDFGETKGQKVFYHKIGTDQREDELIFGRDENSYSEFSYIVTSDERFFIIKETNNEKGIRNFFYVDHLSLEPIMKPLFMKLKSGIDILDNNGDKFIATTKKDANNGIIVEIDPNNPLKWKVIIPELPELLLLKAIPFSDRIVAVYQTNQRPVIIVFDYNGKILFNLKLPIATSVHGFRRNMDDSELSYYIESYTIPPVVYKFNISTFENNLTQRTSVTFDFENIEYKEVEYLSKDGTEVPMILVYKKGLKLNGNNPTILKAYGGFGIINQPSFDPGIVYFINNNGIYAFANIRGGGDKGLTWSINGRGEKKQNSFDDFIAAAEYLIKNNYTNSQKLASTGGSNGGLVVAVSAIQRPELFKAVVPIVAPIDMIRFEKFTVGHFHTGEYGTINDSTSFTRLLAYSPYHNIQEKINYPSMLVITSENDDRVPPFHSFKFVAKLQSRLSQKNSILLKVEKEAGHNGSLTRYKSVRSNAYVYGFIMKQLGD